MYNYIITDVLNVLCTDILPITFRVYLLHVYCKGELRVVHVIKK